MCNLPLRYLRGVVALFLSGVALVCTAGTVNVHVYGPVPLDPGKSANDFHIQVTISQPFFLGAPINYHNGPWGAADGVFTSSPTGFTVDWSGATITGGGPYDFEFDYTINDDATLSGVAYWTLNGNIVQNVPPGVLTFEKTQIPEPSSLALLALAATLLLVQRRQGGAAAQLRGPACV